MRTDVAVPAGTRVAVVDDHPIMREGVAATLNRLGFTVAQAGNVEEVRPPCPVALCDLRLPGRHHAAAVRHLRGLGCRVIAFSQYEDTDTQLGMLAAGACGYLVKTADTQTLGEAVTEVAAGGYWIRPALAQRLRRETEGFGPAALKVSREARTWLRMLSTGDREADFEALHRRPPGAARALTELVLQQLVETRRRIEPTSRELDVIDAVGRQELTNPLAAKTLLISVETLSGHLRRIKEKWQYTHPVTTPEELHPREAARLWAGELYWDDEYPDRA